jgi:nucleoside-diphosphate-sugar epimerase
MEINTHHNKNLLVVGGTGFIGQHVVKKAFKEGFSTTVLSKNNPNSDDKFDGASYLTVDIKHKAMLLTALRDKAFDYVINLGGYVDHVNYSNGGNEVYDVHFNGVRNLVDCLNKSKIKGFVQIGSSDEYGNNPAPQSETQREVPISPYSCAKVASTYFLQTLYRTEKFPAVILRPFLVYGPGQEGERFIPQIIKGCLDNQMFPTSKGYQLRDFCFIEDFVQAIFSALNNKQAYGEVINVASGVPVSIRHMINMVVDIVGSGQPQFGEIPYRVGENMELYADISKSKSILRWTPKVSLDQGIKITIEHFREGDL